jgi:hypothetical protein
VWRPSPKYPKDGTLRVVAQDMTVAGVSVAPNLTLPPIFPLQRYNEAAGAWQNLIGQAQIVELANYAAKAAISLVSPPYPSGTLFLVGGTQLWMLWWDAVAVAYTWKHLGGYDTMTQANIAGFTVGLTANDVGCEIYVSNYHHHLVWAGAAWTWAPGEDGSGYIGFFTVAPVPAAGWVKCDAANAGPQPILLNTGALQNVAVADMVTWVGGATGVFIKGGAAYAGVQLVPTQTAAVTAGGLTVNLAPGAGPQAGAVAHTHGSGEPSAIVLMPYLRK